MFKAHIMEKLKSKVMNLPRDGNHVNKEFSRDIHFQVVSEQSHINEAIRHGDRDSIGSGMDFENESPAQ